MTYVDKDALIQWLQRDINEKETMMHKIIELHEHIEKHLKTNNLTFNKDYNITLIKLAHFCYIHSITSK